MSMHDWAARMGTLLARLPSKRVGAGAAAAGKRLDVKARQESAWDCRAAILLSTTQPSDVRAPPAKPSSLHKLIFSWVLGSGLHGTAAQPPCYPAPGNHKCIPSCSALLMLCCSPTVLLTLLLICICHMPGRSCAPKPALGLAEVLVSCSVPYAGRRD